MNHRHTRTRRILTATALVTTGILLAIPAAFATNPGDEQNQIQSSISDFTLKGTLPNSNGNEFAPLYSAANCMFCHGDYGIEVPPYDTWVVSLMGQARREPVYNAGVTIANQDANAAGNFCVRCHSPVAFFREKALDGNIDDFTTEEMDGVNCTTCHRMVNPEYGPDSAIGYPGDPQDPDLPIISALTKSGQLPTSVGNAQLVVDPNDTRRAQYSDVPANLHGGAIDLITSPYHQESEFCGSCHNVGSPLYHRTAQNTFELNKIGIEGPTTNVLDTTPEQRTYSEWLHSDFATTGVVFEDGRFGGSLPDDQPIRSCQNCHMPPQVGGACGFYENPPFFERNDVGAHSFAGGNTWVLNAIVTQEGFDAEFYGMTPERVNAANARTAQMLQDASDMSVEKVDNEIVVRITNQSGHKLPTGYPEGRRMWLNVKFFNSAGDLIKEHGEYDYDTAVLDKDDTKVYEKKMGISENIANLTNLPAGESFHLVLNDYIISDNCIPPRGFTNAAFETFNGKPVNYTYADGQYWDDTNYSIPSGAVTAVSTLYFQTSSREYIEFLRDNNVSDDRGNHVYDLWVNEGKSAPLAMDSMEIPLENGNPADLNGDGIVDGADLGLLLIGWGTTGPGDINGDGVVDGADLGLMLIGWT